MANFEKLANNSLWVIGIIFCLLAFIVSTQSGNNAQQPLTDDPRFNNTFNFLENNLSDNKNQIDEQFGIFTNETPERGLGSLVFFSIVGFSKTAGNMVTGVATIIIKLPVAILQIDDSLVNIFLTWLTIVIVLALWSTWKFG